MTGAPEPVVTVAIPTFRRPMLLRRAILSALDQRGPPVRVCVFDNCSEDGTGDMVREIMAGDPRVEYHCHERNLGAAANFDFALNSIRTPYFSLLSDDDYLLPGFYQHALVALESCASAIFWAGITLNVDEGGRLWDARVARWPREGIFQPPGGALAMTGGTLRSEYVVAAIRRSLESSPITFHVHPVAHEPIAGLIKLLQRSNEARTD